MAQKYNSQTTAGGDNYALKFRGLQGPVGNGGSPQGSGGNLVGGQLSDNIRATMRFRVRGLYQVNTVAVGDTVGVLLVVYDGNNGPYNLQSPPTLSVVRNDGSSALAATTMEAEDGGVYLIEYATVAADGGKVLTFTISGTNPLSGNPIVLRRNLECLLGETGVA